MLTSIKYDILNNTQLAYKIYAAAVGILIVDIEINGPKTKTINIT
jgi:hypothetical protein